MVSYFNSSLNTTLMYRNNQPPNGQFPPPPPPPNSSWYTPINYHNHHHQNNQSSSIHPGYNAIQDDQQFWPPHHHHHHHHPSYHHHHHHQFNEFHTNFQQLPYHHHHNHQEQIGDNNEHQLPSPPMTVGSDISSPGNITENTALNQDHNGSPTTKTTSTPYEWINKSSLHKEAEPGKTRTKDKYRVVYTDHQRVELEKEFYYSRYITMRRKTELANSLGLSERQVKIWFQNRRAKERKQVKKRDDINQNDNSIINTIHNIL